MSKVVTSLDPLPHGGRHLDTTPVKDPQNVFDALLCTTLLAALLAAFLAQAHR
ncbi:hypothetical protein ACIREE_40350 [Streptomyces sp. NPDC102467]|uniref:hypothetical protein n=1 Tax=Streptomyces sp. NPDC102467 TaxID=3366179 RepID=UPI0037FC84DA